MVREYQPKSSISEGDAKYYSRWRFTGLTTHWSPPEGSRGQTFSASDRHHYSGVRFIPEQTSAPLQVGADLTVKDNLRHSGGDIAYFSRIKFNLEGKMQLPKFAWVHRRIIHVRPSEPLAQPAVERSLPRPSGSRMPEWMRRLFN